MRQKDVSKWFETLLSEALATAPGKHRPGIIAAAYIMKELALDIKRLSEAVETLATTEEEKLRLLREAGLRRSMPTGYRPPGGIDDDIPF